MYDYNEAIKVLQHELEISKQYENSKLTSSLETVIQYLQDVTD